MKYSIVVAVLLAFCNFSVAAKDSAFNGYPSVEAAMNARTAPIHTKAQLETYLAVTPDSPIHKMGETKMQSFIDSLVFAPAGLGSYSIVELEGMASSDIYAILALFGLQSDASSIPQRSVVSEADHFVEGRLGRAQPVTRLSQACLVGPGHGSGYCEPLAGSRCSYLCKLRR